MTAPDCAYCTDIACGVDADGEFTCGCVSCTPIETALPIVIALSDADDGDDT